MARLGLSTIRFALRDGDVNFFKMLRREFFLAFKNLGVSVVI